MTNLTKLILVSLIALSTFCSAQSLPPTPQSLPAGSAVISDLKGDVWITASQQTTPVAAQKGQVIGPNTALESKKGSALLTLSDGSQVLVKPNTRVILQLPDASKGNFLEEMIGKIVAKVKKRTGNEPPFKMGTPSAVITVRGTQFLVDVTDKQQTIVQVYEGLVQVEGFGGGGHSVYLGPGYVTRVGRNDEPENPRRPLDEVPQGGSGAKSGKSSENEGWPDTNKPGESSGGAGESGDDGGPD